MIDQQQSLSSQEAINLEEKYGAHNYHPLPAVLDRGEGVHVWDCEGKKYFDFLSAYSAVNQGHCHPHIVDALKKQAERITLTSRAFFNSKLGLFNKFMSEYFHFDKVLPMNSGAEAVETAIKLCRKWAYEKRGIPENEAQIVVVENNFHGRTTTIVSFSSDPDSYQGYGPYTPGFIRIPYNDKEEVEKALSQKNVVGFLVEPIQGEAGVVVPDHDYLSFIREQCDKNNALMLTDEIQTGIARTGSLLASCGNCDCKGKCERQPDTYVRPDILILGKALSGGVYPVSAILADDEVMLAIKPGEHGSTFGGNPVAAEVAMAALEVVDNERLMENARSMGDYFRSRMQEFIENHNIVKLVRGKGLLNAIVINDSPDSKTAWNICVKLKENGLLAKPTHGNIIRFAPPLVITKEEMDECVNIITSTLEEFDK